MRGLSTTRCCWLALRAASALTLTIAPYQIALHGHTAGVVAASAHAKDGGSGSGHGSGGSGSGSSGSGSNSGSGGSDDGGGDDHGNDGAGDDHGDDGAGDDHGGQGENDDDGHHVNAETGDKVEAEGDKIEVEHVDGTKEEVENGRFEMKDAAGRTIVERPATPDDISRLQAL
ncbi:hypothetical protein [Mesorhizobium sp.]|uniref:hypothetical protein n=1 Tax=Mesorhizobium sp. TaxID=1871066 RepID=UPI0035619A9D